MSGDIERHEQRAPVFATASALLTERIAALSPESPVEDVLAVRDLCDWLRTFGREASRLADEATMAWIDANGDIEVSETTRLYVGIERDKKCRDPQLTLHKLLEATDGDEGRVIECLASNPWKPGACANVLTEEAWAECFEVIEKKDIKTGKPSRKVQKADSRFTK